MRLNSRVEIELTRCKDRPGVQIADAAVDGHPVWYFDIHDDEWNDMNAREKDRYLERAATTLFHRYGDRREIRIREDGQIVPRFGEADG